MCIGNGVNKSTKEVMKLEEKVDKTLDGLFNLLKIINPVK